MHSRLRVNFFKHLDGDMTKIVESWQDEDDDTSFFSNKYFYCKGYHMEPVNWHETFFFLMSTYGIRTIINICCFFSGNFSDLGLIDCPLLNIQWQILYAYSGRDQVKQYLKK